MKNFSKRLYKSADNKVIFGVMGGFGEYFDIDPVILRVIYAGVSIFTAIIPGIIAYLIAALLMPNAPHTFHRSETDHHKTEHDQKTHETPEV